MISLLKIVKFAVLLVIYFTLLLPALEGPAVRRYEQTDIPQFTTSAIQHLERGLRETYGRDYRRDGVTRYLNNPGLLTVTLSLFVKFLGTSNIAARSMSILFNIITFALLLYLSARIKFPAILAAVIFFSMPIVIVYGRDLSYHNIITPLLLLSLIIFINRPNNSPSYYFYFLMFILTWLTASFGWVGYFVYPLFIAWEYQENRDIRLLAVLVMSCFCALGLVLWQNLMITGSAVQPLIETLSQGDFYKHRIIYDYKESFGAGSWLVQQAEFLVKNFSGPVLLSSLFGVIISLRHIYKRVPLTFLEKIAWGAGAFAISFMVITGAYSYVHSYLQWLLVPAFFLFTVLFFKNILPRYYWLAIFLYLSFSLPVTTILVLRFYQAYF